MTPAAPVATRGPLNRARISARFASAFGLLEGTVRFELRLKPGAHQLPIADGPAFIIAVPEGCIAAGFVAFGPGDGSLHGAGPLIQGIRVEFSPAVRLPNVLDALIEVRKLTGQAGPEADALYDRNLGDVLISGVTARPVWSDDRGQWKLSLGWSGHARPLDRATWPFWDVVLPEFILPRLHASLSHLLSKDPLATATVRKELVDPLAAARALCKLLATGMFEVNLALDPPTVVLDSVLGDLTRFVAEAGIKTPISVAGRFSVANESDHIAAAASSLCLKCNNREALIEGTAELKLDLDSPEMPLERRITGRLQLDVAGDFPELHMTGRTSHPLAPGGSEVRVVSALGARGRVCAAWDGERFHLDDGPKSIRGKGRRTSVAFDVEFSLPEQVLVRRAAGGLSGAITGGLLHGTIRHARPGTWSISFGLDADASHRFETLLSPIPELGISDPTLKVLVDAGVKVKGSGTVRVGGAGLPGLVVTPSGNVELTLRRAMAELDGRRLELPAMTTLRGRFGGVELRAGSLGELALDLSWDLHGKTCLLSGRDRSVPLLSNALRRGVLKVSFSPSGRIQFTGGGGGLHGARFLNALLNPTREGDYLVGLLRSDEAMSQVSAILELFDSELASGFNKLRSWAASLRDHLREVGVEQVGDAIPRPVIARLLSRMIVGDDSIEADLRPLVKDVTEGRGLDVVAAKQILMRTTGNRRWYELDGLLRWLDLVLRPSEPLPRAEATPEPPLVDDPRYRPALEGLPSAAQIYDAAQGKDTTTPARVAELAPYLTLGQLDYILGLVRHRWPGDVVMRLEHVRDIKRKVASVEETDFGLALGAHAARIATFIGEAVGPLPGVSEEVPECALGPKDVAVLLQTGLAEGRQGLQAQINNRLLMELIRNRPGEFLREVLVEMGQQVPRILTSVLWAFLHQDQDELLGPLDIAALLSEKLGVPVPRQEDYMAGGRKARKSYYEALASLADTIMQAAGPYLARRAWLREFRHEIPPGPRPAGHAASLQADAVACIRNADELGRRCDFSLPDGEAHRVARAAYRQAFEACSAFLREVPDGFQLPFFRAFWARNEEALKVLSVVRNYQEAVDDVRNWLTVAAGGAVGDSEQDLLETVVRCLYWYEEDRKTLLLDPLVRLLIDPDPGPWNFTVVACMGVITEGAQGRELEDAFRRLEERRGVRIIRAHTGLFRSLEYNAAAIIREIKKIKGPWGYIGYSQGCANALMAESFLFGGTPAEQALLAGLKCRNLLFSAANGSVHGTSGAIKFLRAMVEGERFLKHYQAEYSREAVGIVLRALRTFMDSRAFLKTLGGTFSLSLERARILHREGQFVPGVPTSTTRGAVTPDRLPETLEYLWYCHERLLPGAIHDSQVPAEEAIGQATRVRNERTEVLARCDMGSMVQHIHHWSPLTAEVEFVTTDRDRARAVYQSPKDRHVFPWLEVNARFGRIGR